MRGIILAAGDGGRLRPLTHRRSKVLLPVGDRPLISYPLEALASSGVTDIAVVVGYRASQVIEALREWTPTDARIEFIHNPDYDGGNALSLMVAKGFVGDDPFILCMGDHIIHRSVVAKLLAARRASAVLGIDSAASQESQLNDATRVLTGEDRRLLRIGKRLRNWNAVDIGVFRFEPGVFRVLDGLYERHGDALELSDLMQFLADQEQLVDTCDIGGLYWTDVDTVEDYRSAERYMERLDGVRL